MIQAWHIHVRKNNTKMILLKLDGVTQSNTQFDPKIPNIPPKNLNQKHKIDVSKLILYLPQ